MFHLRGIPSKRLQDHWYPMLEEDSAHVQYQMLICSAKCRCVAGDPSDDPEYGALGPIRLDLNKVYQWDFDNKLSTGKGFDFDRDGPSLNLIEEGPNDRTGEAGVHEDGRICKIYQIE
jgi:hypothetical protein